MKQNRLLPMLGCLLAVSCLNAVPLGAAEGESTQTPRRKPLASAGDEPRETRAIAGWTVHVSQRLLAEQKAETERALELLQAQLDEIVRVVPKAAVAELQKVPLWFSPEYPGAKPTAEYHPDVNWLREHGRPATMAKSVEFTNVRIFAAETQRMPNFALHELAHAYHDRVLGFEHPEIKAAYEKARASQSYDAVERWNGPSRPKTKERAYAMTDPREYFAETSEAFFSRNDFFPFNRDELAQHDPEMFKLLQRLWQVSLSAILEDKDVRGKWWCFYKQNGLSLSWSRDLKTWMYSP